MKTRSIIKSAIPIKRGLYPEIKKSKKSNAGATSLNESNHVLKIVIPDQNDPAGRTTRLHEMVHAKHSLHTNLTDSIAGQAIEDCYVHLKYWPTALTESSEREVAEMAYLDSMQLRFSKENNKQKNMALWKALKSMAVVTKLGSKEQMREVRHNVRTSFPRSSVVEHFDEIIKLVNKDRREQALQKFQRLLEIKNPSDGVADHGEGGSSGKPNGLAEGEDTDGNQCNPFEDDTGIGESLLERLMEMVAPKDTPDGTHPMAIIELPRVDHCDPLEKFAGGTAPASNGQRLVVKRFPNALATGQTFGLFRHRSRIRKYQGTCLIDASSSMEMDNDTLKQLCNDSSFMQVAYYSNYIYDSNKGEFGSLAIYAKDGKRASSILYRNGGNGVDLFALRWLLLQQPPIYLVSDLEFCGGPSDQAALAMELFALEKERITQFSSCDAALDFFKLKRASLI